MNFQNLFDSNRDDEDGIDQSSNLGKNNEDLLSVFNREHQIEDTDKMLNWKNSEDFSSISNRDRQIEDMYNILNWKNDEDSNNYDNILYKNIQDIKSENVDPLMANRYVSEDKEIKKEKEPNAKDKALDEINSLENKDTSNKTASKYDINEKENPFNGLKNKFICKKRKESFPIDNSNEKNKENTPNKKESIKPEKVKEKNPPTNNSSLVPEIKSFHTLFNIYFKYLVEEGNSFNVSVFNKKGGANGFYITRDFTQSNLGAKENSLKLNENIAKFIKKEKLEKIKKKKLSLDVLSLKVRDLIYMFYGYIFENKEYFEKNEIIKKINQNFIRIRKYPFIDFENGKSDEKFKFGYFKYYD